ncbi:unnamed protein product, partial [Scytosiphon promiscuus]
MISWSKTGYLDPATVGLYALTDVGYDPPSADASFDVLLVHPGLPRIYAFLHIGENNYVDVQVYDENNSTGPLVGTGIIDITGADGEEDEVVQAAASISQTVVSYVGCFQDSSGSRIMEKVETESDMTIEGCEGLCTGSPYYGLQFSKECWCGDITTEAQMEENGPAENCDMQCAGNELDICGGRDAMSVYSMEDASIIGE